MASARRRAGTVNPAQLSADQYVSPSVIDREAEASKSQRGDVQLQKEAGPPMPTVPTTVQVVAPVGKKKKKKKKKGKSPAPQTGPRETGGQKSLGSLSPPKAVKGPVRERRILHLRRWS